MAKILSGEDLFDAMKQAISAANSPKIAIAFWGSGAMDKLGLSKKTRAKIICNLSMGGTNPYEIERLVDAGLDVYALDTLHAKFGTFGGCGFVGSSNASSNGLGLQAQEVQHWYELNVWLEAQEQIKELDVRFDALCKRAGPKLTAADHRLAIAKNVWKARRRVVERMPRTKENASLLTSIKTERESYVGSGVYLILCGEVPKKDQRKFELAQKKVEKLNESELAEVDCYQDWDAEHFPDSATIIDFTMPSGKFSGFYERDETLMDFKKKSVNYLTVRQISGIRGFAGIHGSTPDWRSVVQRLWERQVELCGEVDTDAVIIPVENIELALEPESDFESLIWKSGR